MNAVNAFLISTPNILCDYVLKVEIFYFARSFEKRSRNHIGILARFVLLIWRSKCCACSNYAFSNKFYARLIYLSFFAAPMCLCVRVCCRIMCVLYIHLFP